MCLNLMRPMRSRAWGYDLLLLHSMSICYPHTHTTSSAPSCVFSSAWENHTFTLTNHQTYNCPLDINCTVCVNRHVLCCSN